MAHPLVAFLLLVGSAWGQWPWSPTPPPTPLPPTVPAPPSQSPGGALPAGLKEGERVMTAHGPVRGVLDDSAGAKIWWGIPFAAPPVGKLRFAPPVPPTPWTEEWKATAPSPQCPQLLLASFAYSGQEDCLYLSVYAPATAKPGDKLPVMFWIYGGGLSTGSENADGLYDGRNLAVAEGVVVVAVNYRLNNIGFLALRSLLREYGTTGTYGLLDQQLGLRWVQANIEQFGGDRERVTLFGRSAGGLSVAAHLVMPSSRGLFHGAIVQSGLLEGDITWPSFEQSSQFGEVVAQKLGCGHKGRAQLDCLRGLPLGDVLNSRFDSVDNYDGVDPSLLPKLLPVMTYWPAVDGAVLPMSPVEAARKGLLYDVPLIVGTARDDGSIFVPSVPVVIPRSLRGILPLLIPLSDRSLRLTTQHILGHNETVQQAAYNYYKQSGLLGPSIAVAAMTRDFMFACPARRFLRGITAMAHVNHTSPVYLYHYTYGIDSALSFSTFASATHSGEVEYVFGNPTSTFGFSTEEKSVVSRVQRYWANFARNVRGSGSPSDGGCLPEGCSPNWPAYGDQPQQQRHLVIDFPPRVEGGYYDDVCDFWDSHPSSLHS